MDEPVILLSVVIPAYNEERTLASLVAAMGDALIS